MTNKPVSRAFRPLLLIFIITNVLFLTSRARLTQWDVNVDVLIIGNLIVFAASAVSFYLFTRSLHSKNPQAVVRTVYSGVVSKMMICLVTRRRAPLPPTSSVSAYVPGTSGVNAASAAVGFTSTLVLLAGLIRLYVYETGNVLSVSVARTG